LMWQNNEETYQEDDNYLWEEEKSIEAGTKEIEMIKVIGKNKENVKLQQMN
jgi:hypothetical protein